MLTPLEGHSSLVFNDQIWVFGGSDGKEFDGTSAETSFFDGFIWSRGPDLLRIGFNIIIL